MPNVYKAVIVEDEAPAGRLLNELLSSHRDLIHLSGEAYNGSDAVALINEINPDLIFLDIQLPDMLGLDVLKQLVYHPYVIFTTAYDEYAMKAFDALSVDYLLKPLKEDRIVRALTKLQHFAGCNSPYSAWNNLELLSNDIPPPKEIRTPFGKKRYQVYTRTTVGYYIFRGLRQIHLCTYGKRAKAVLRSYVSRSGRKIIV